MTSSDVKTEALREQIRRIRRELAPGVDLKPASAYEAVTRQVRWIRSGMSCVRSRSG